MHFFVNFADDAEPAAPLVADRENLGPAIKICPSAIGNFVPFLEAFSLRRRSRAQLTVDLM
jgi:hypothetical protein